MSMKYLAEELEFVAEGLNLGRQTKAKSIAPVGRPGLASFLSGKQATNPQEEHVLVAGVEPDPLDEVASASVKISAEEAGTMLAAVIFLAKNDRAAINKQNLLDKLSEALPEASDAVLRGIVTVTLARYGELVGQ
jgi:hypothetical protein